MGKDRKGDGRDLLTGPILEFDTKILKNPVSIYYYSVKNVNRISFETEASTFLRLL
jgi:hypothetical protein